MRHRRPPPGAIPPGAIRRRLPPSPLVKQRLGQRPRPDCSNANFDHRQRTNETDADEIDADEINAAHLVVFFAPAFNGGVSTPGRSAFFPRPPNSFPFWLFSWQALTREKISFGCEAARGSGGRFVRRGATKRRRRAGPDRGQGGRLAGSAPARSSRRVSHRDRRRRTGCGHRSGARLLRHRRTRAGSVGPGGAPRVAGLVIVIILSGARAGGRWSGGGQPRIGGWAGLSPGGAGRRCQPGRTSGRRRDRRRPSGLSCSRGSSR